MGRTADHHTHSWQKDPLLNNFLPSSSLTASHHTTSLPFTHRQLAERADLLLHFLPEPDALLSHGAHLLGGQGTRGSLSTACTYAMASSARSYIPFLDARMNERSTTLLELDKEELDKHVPASQLISFYAIIEHNPPAAS